MDPGQVSIPGGTLLHAPRGDGPLADHLVGLARVPALLPRGQGADRWLPAAGRPAAPRAPRPRLRRPALVGKSDSRIRCRAEAESAGPADSRGGPPQPGLPLHWTPTVGRGGRRVCQGLRSLALALGSLAIPGRGPPR